MATNTAIQNQDMLSYYQYKPHWKWPAEHSIGMLLKYQTLYQELLEAYAFYKVLMVKVPWKPLY